MADAEVRFKAGIDDKEAQKELKQIESRIERLNDAISKGTDKKNIIAEKLKDAEIAAEDVQRKLEGLNDIKLGKEAAADMQKALSDIDKEIEETQSRLESMRDLMVNVQEGKRKGNLPALEDNYVRETESLENLRVTRAEIEADHNALMSMIQEEEAALGVPVEEAIKRTQAEIKTTTAEVTRRKNEEQKVTDQIRLQNEEINRLNARQDDINNQLRAQSMSSWPAVKDAATVAADSISTGFKKGFKTLLRYGLGIRSTFILIRRLRTALVEGIKEFAEYDDETKANIDGLKASLQGLKGSFVALAAPIFNVVAPALQQFILWVKRGIEAVSAFAAMLGGKSSYKRAAEGISDAAGAISDAASAAKELDRYTSGLDEMKKWQSSTSASSGSSSGSSSTGSGLTWEEVPIDTESNLAQFAMKVKDIVFDWSDLTYEMIAEKAIAALSAISGAIIGGAIGGVPGAIIGLLAGATLGIVSDSVIFNNDGTLSRTELAALIAPALTAAVGGIIGFVATGNPAGALIGASIGFELTLALETLFIDAKESYIKEQSDKKLAEIKAWLASHENNLLSLPVEIKVQGTIDDLTTAEKENLLTEVRKKHVNPLSEVTYDTPISIKAQSSINVEKQKHWYDPYQSPVAWALSQVFGDETANNVTIGLEALTITGLGLELLLGTPTIKAMQPIWNDIVDALFPDFAEFKEDVKERWEEVKKEIVDYFKNDVTGKDIIDFILHPLEHIALWVAGQAFSGESEIGNSLAEKLKGAIDKAFGGDGNGDPIEVPVTADVTDAKDSLTVDQKTLPTTANWTGNAYGTPWFRDWRTGLVWDTKANWLYNGYGTTWFANWRSGLEWNTKANWLFNSYGTPWFRDWRTGLVWDTKANWLYNSYGTSWFANWRNGLVWDSTAQWVHRTYGNGYSGSTFAFWDATANFMNRTFGSSFTTAIDMYANLYTWYKDKSAWLDSYNGLPLYASLYTWYRGDDWKKSYNGLDMYAYLSTWYRNKSKWEDSFDYLDMIASLKTWDYGSTWKTSYDLLPMKASLIGVDTSYITSKALGGVFSGGVWHDIPQYAGGTTNAHGSVFIAGEAGPEVVGHIGGRTEVLNRSQLASAVAAGVRQAIVQAFSKLRFEVRMPEVTPDMIPAIAKGQVIPPQILGGNSGIDDIKASIDKLTAALNRQGGNNSYRFTAQINRRTLFDELMEEAQIRRNQSGLNPFMAV